MNPERNALEKVGPAYSLEKMRRASRLSRDALHRIAGRIRPGMTEGEATQLAKEEFARAGAEKHWHRPLVRFGRETLKIYSDPSSPETVLEPDDIFFLDVGPVWDGHEGDVGETFVLGGDPEKLRVREAAHAIWEETAERWREGDSGAALYAFARQACERRNVLLREEIQGHRLSDFPHHAHARGAVLGKQEYVPIPGAWVLEIQVRHPTLPFGAFCEDLLG